MKIDDDELHIEQNKQITESLPYACQDNNIIK